MKILIADDDPISRLMLSRVLSGWNYEVVTADNGVEAWRVLQEEESAPRLAILDWMMPGMDGPDICQRVRSQANRYTYILLLTARNDKDDIISGLVAGADDYLTKPVSTAELKARLGVGLRVLDLEDRLARSYENAKFEAAHDQLTGLLNRSAILQQLHAECERSRRENSCFAVLLADVDHFKQINDKYGHLAGDAVLHQVGQDIKASVRPYDWVGRYGGEEFLLIVSNCSRSDAMAIAERMRSAIASTSVRLTGQDQALSISISIGVANSDDVDLLEEAALLRAADSAMYRAKNLGRNRCEPAPVERRPALQQVWAQDNSALPLNR